MALYRTDWIDALTKRELTLLRRYTRLLDAGTFLVPPGHVEPLRSETWTALHLNPVLAADVGSACERWEQMREQRNDVHHWLKTHGFDSERNAVDREAFERAFAADFGGRAQRNRRSNHSSPHVSTPATVHAPGPEPEASAAATGKATLPRRHWKAPRFTEDDNLAQEGAAMIRDGKVGSASAAAEKLADRAGGHSRRAKVDRLRKKIGRAYREAQG